MSRTINSSCFPLLGLGLLLSLFLPGASGGQGLAAAGNHGQEAEILELNAQAVQYYLGEGIVKNYPKAAELFLKAARLGSAVAQFNLGYMYEKGIGLGSDYTQAYVFYQLAARQGYVAAQEPLNQLRGFMAAEKIAELENNPSPFEPSSLAPPPQRTPPAYANKDELQSWIRNIKPAAGR